MKGILRFSAVLLLIASGPAAAQSPADLADQCDAAVASGDRTAFTAVASKVVQLRNVFDTDARTRLEDCLTDGYGEPWEYDWPAGAFMSSAAVEAKLREAEVQKGREARAAAAAAQAEADLQAAKVRNANRIAALVYSSCSTLFDRDQVAAMTNQLCVDSFLSNGLPQP